jgi:hypothetical protein
MKLKISIPSYVLAIAAIAALSGCAAQTPAKHGTGPIALAAQLSSAPSSVRFSMRISGLADGLPLSATETGVTNLTAARQGTAEEDIDLAGQNERVRVVDDGGIEYLAQVGSTPTGSSQQLRWARRDLDQLSARLGVTDLAAVQAHGLGLLGPFAALRFEAKAGRVQRIGGTVINGVDVTHYGVVIDRRRLATSGPVWIRKAAAYSLAHGSRTERLDIWVDGRGLVRRASFPLLSAASDLLEQPAFDGQETIDFLSYAKPVSIARPPAHLVVDETGALIGRYDELLSADRQLTAALSRPQRWLHVNGSAVTFKYPSVLEPEGQALWRRGHLAVALGDRNAGVPR